MAYKVENFDDKITLNGKALQYGVLSDGAGDYQVYLYPGMTVAELAFNMMVTIRLLKNGGYIKGKKTVYDLIDKYMRDPQYAPLSKNEKK